MAKKVTWSLKTKTHVCPKPYGSAIVKDAAVQAFTGILKSAVLANNGRYQISVVDQDATESQIELPTSGPADAVEYVETFKARGLLNDAYVTLPGLKSGTNAALETALENFAKQGNFLSRDGVELGEIQRVQSYIQDYQVKAAAQNGGN